MFILYLYILSLVFSLLQVLWFYLSDVKSSIVQHIMLLIMVIVNLGYISLIKASDVSTAILSNKIVYLGGCFLPLLYFITVCEVCHVIIKKPLFIFMICSQSLIFLFVCSIGFTDWYYKDVTLHIENGLSYITKVYGPTHNLFLLSMAIYMIASLIISIKSYLGRKSINKKEVFLLEFYCFAACLSYIVERVFNIKYDIMPISYNLLMNGALLAIYHSNLFTGNENQKVINDHLKNIGFISFNKKMELMDVNDYALNLFPQLQNIRVGKKIVNPGKELSRLIEDVVLYLNKQRNPKSYYHQNGIKISVNKKYYETKNHVLKNYLHHIVGVTVEINDVTFHTKMLMLKEKYNEELNKDVELKTQQIRSIQEKTILGIAQTIEARDLSTGGHVKRTSDVVRIFSEQILKSDLHLEKKFLQLLIRAAPMHDVGKIGVPDAILQKRGRFTKEDFEIMKTHAPIGGKLVQKIYTGVEEEDFVIVAYNVASYHHEKVNGKGYPNGLKGEEIPIEARIMALADVFDALVSKRCYKKAYSYDKAFAIIEKDAGKHFDARLVSIFLKCRKELEKYYDINCPSRDEYIDA